jgi:lipopolysaccharide transport system permease protein
MTPVATALAWHGARPLAGLVWTLVRTDFRTRYHGTLGGFLWALLKPLAMFLVLLGVFSYVFPGQPRYKLDLIIGLFLYDFFQEGTKTGLLSLRAKGYLLARARFPSWVLVVTSASNALITLALFSVLLVVALAASGRAPSPAATALYALYQLHFLAIVAGFSLAASVLFLRYRDLNQVWEVLTHAGFFVAPIIYPIDVLPERLHLLLYLWPPTPIILFSRSVLVDGEAPSLIAHALLAAEAALILGVGAAVYAWRSRGLAEDL